MHLPKQREVRFVLTVEVINLHAPTPPELVVAVGERGGIGCAEPAGSLPIKVAIPIDDNDVERCRSCDGGEHGSKEARPWEILEIY